MAFSKAPTLDTYSSQKVPVVWDLSLMGPTASTDISFMSRITNMLPYKVPGAEDQFFLKTRFGFFGNQVVGAGANIVRGCYVWEKTIGTFYLYVVVYNAGTNTVYTSTDMITWTSVNTFTEASTGPIRFTEFISSTNTKKLVMVTGTKGYVFTDNTAGTAIADADFPNPHVPFPVFLDGYLYLAKAGTGDLYNSDIDDPAAWTAGNFISAETYPDDIQALIKIDNYILAVGQYGSEYFQDAGNASGSPLARVEGAVIPYGTLFPNAIAYNKETAVIIGQDDNGFALYAIEKFKFKQIGSRVPMYILNSQLANGTITSTGLRGMFVRNEGELLYVLNYKGDSVAANPLFYTFAYSFTADKWVRFTTKGTTQQWPIMFTTSGISTNPTTFVAGHANAAGVFFGYIQPTVAYDNDSQGQVAVFQEILIPPQTFGTLNNKAMNRFGLFYNRLTETATPVGLSWSDDNMVTFTTSRNFDGTVQGGYPFMTQLGSFRNRGFKLSFITGFINVYYAEVDINKGTR